jgi:hypothetical protein
MMRLHLGVVDLASVRFAYSPLQEAVLSLWVWRRPDKHAVHLPWVRGSAPLLAQLDRPLLQALVGPHGYLPDFLTPRPEVPLPRLEDELATLRATPLDQVVDDVLAAQHPRPASEPLPEPLRLLHQDPAAVLAAVADALEAYWDLLLAPHWPRMRAVLDADVAYRGRQLANGGAAALFADLDGRLRWDGRTLHIDGHHDDLDIDVAGRGLPLTPSLFARGTIGLVDQALPPYLTYPARGRAELWDGPPPAAAPVLAALLGGSRARLLADLDEPSSTTELARRHGLSPGSVSQHLQVLHRAGLLRRSRAGRTVFYRRSLLGDRLSAGG